MPYFIVLLNSSELGFSFVVFHDKAKRTQQGDLLFNVMIIKSHCSRRQILVGNRS